MENKPYLVSMEDLHRMQAQKSTYPAAPSQAPPPVSTTITGASASPWYNPCGWSRKTKWIAGGMATLLTAGVIVGAVVGGVKTNTDNRYPDYNQLQYHLKDDYMGSEFFNRFDYYSDVDPTHGFVEYVDRATAHDLNLTYTTAESKSAVIRVDTANPPTARGRQSVRIESKAQYDHGLFIFDIAHTPVGCGLWPALWLVDAPNHPWHGEIDIVETDNMATEGNVVTLHTWEGCDMEGVERRQTGTIGTLNCGDGDAAGCSVRGHPESDGERMNSMGGGVYALEMREAGIRTWFFRRGQIPEDVSSLGKGPDPSMWGVPLADFPGTKCDILSHFTNQSIIVNIDLCGEQGGVYDSSTGQYKCPAMCEDALTVHPQKLAEAYWEFKGFKVYQAG